LVQKSGIGFIDPETVGLTIAESVSEIDRVIELKPEESLDLSKLTITQSVSDSVSKTNKSGSKRNKRKVRDHSVPKEKVKLLKNEKSGSQGNESQSKSESVSQNTKSDSDKIISNYVESRTGKVSNKGNFLKDISDSKLVDQRKLRIESKKSGIGKGFAKEETLIVAKKNFKSGKGQIKQQWVSKCDKSQCSTSQSESDPRVSSGEPISRWVPKMN
jgi:hypothetical protein